MRSVTGGQIDPAAGPDIRAPSRSEWSRNASITSFGDNGFAVFHAGHCD